MLKTYPNTTSTASNTHFRYQNAIHILVVILNSIYFHKHYRILPPLEDYNIYVLLLVRLNHRSVKYLWVNIVFDQNSVSQSSLLQSGAHGDILGWNSPQNSGRQPEDRAPLCQCGNWLDKDDDGTLETCPTSYRLSAEWKVSC